MTYQKLPKSIKDIRANTNELDHWEEPFHAPEPTKYAHGAERNNPKEPATNSAELLMWSRRYGAPAPSVVGFALWEAVLTWAKPLRVPEALEAIRLHRGVSAAGIRSEKAEVTLTPEHRTLAEACREGWRAAGMPFYAEGMRRAQRFAIIELGLDDARNG